MEQFFADFDDPFFYSILTVVVALSFIDFLLGEDRRQRMRSGLETFWLHIATMSFTGLAREDARVVLTWLRDRFGTNWKTPRFMIVAMAVSGIFSLYAIFLLMMLDTRDARYTNYIYPGIIIPNALMDWLSLAITMWLLKQMSERGSSALLLLGVIAADIVAACVLSALAIGGMILLSVIAPAIIPSARSFIPVLGHWFMPAVMVFMTSILPTLLHLGLSFVFLGSKLFRPLIQKPLSILIYPFTESKKGPLTLIACGLGAVAKLLQQWDRYYDSVPAA